MKVSRRQIRNLIREELKLLKEQAEAAVVELTDPEITQRDISSAWPDGVFHEGKKVFDTFYSDRATSAAWSWLQSEGYGDGQEAYLGYDPQSDMFVMGFDAWADNVDEYGNSDMGGEMEGVLILLDPDGRVIETMTSAPGGMYPAGIREAHAAMPMLVDVRLD